MNLLARHVILRALLRWTAAVAFCIPLKHTGDGLNLWIPVRDEPAALRLLAEQGIRVAAGKPFLPSLRISADIQLFDLV